MILNQDFKNVFGNNIIGAIKRSCKGLLVLKGMMTGADIASSKMPIRLQIEVTNKCNHDCIMCERVARKNGQDALNNDITHKSFDKLVELMNPFYVTLNGLGEPLLNVDIDKILTSCQRRHITTSMPCNLSVPRVLNNEIVKSPPDIITFSVHGASKEIFESISRKSNYERCIASLRQFLSLTEGKRLSVRILCALQAKNLLEYKNMYNLLSELNLLDNFVLVPVYDYGHHHDESCRIIPTELEIEKAITILNKDISVCASQAEGFFYTRWKGVIGEIVANNASNQEKTSAPCLIPWFSTYIAADGNVLPCCYLLAEDYIMGNVFLGTSFDLIWNGQAYREFRNSIRENRAQLKGCNYCPRDDSMRIKKYGFLFRRGMKWKV